MRQYFNSARVPKNQLLPGVQGLRGIAALAVVLYHLIWVGNIKPPAMFDFIGRDFGFSVHLFFIMSAYSLMHSTKPKVGQPNWLTGFFIKRFFRIAPLFYSMIIFFVAFRLFQLNNLKALANLLLNLTFTFDFVPGAGIVWGAWSVGVEMIFYAIFPILILLINSCRVSFIFLIISIIISCALRSALHTQYLGLDPTANYDWSYFTFPSNIYFFAMGIYAYLLGQFYPKNSKIISIFVPLIALVIIFGLLFSDFSLTLNNSSRLDLVLWGIGLTALCIWQANHPSAIISNKIFQFMGERSYSIYLLHPVIIFFSKDFLLKTYTVSFPFVETYAYFVCLVILMVMILFVTEATYRVIELPGIDLGKRLMALKKYA